MTSHMKAWRLERPGGALTFKDVPIPEPRPGSVLVRIEVSTLMSYMKGYVEGRLPFYNPPKVEYTIGTNGVGIVEAVGGDVWHIKPGQRVLISSHFIARDNVDDPNQILIGLTAGTGADAMLSDWPDGTLAEYALVPVEAVTPVDGLDHVDAAHLAAVSRCIIPFGGLLRGRLAAGETLVVTGATGAYGTAAVLLAVGMGAARVVAAGRNQARLEAIAEAGGPRVATVVLKGDPAEDAAALRAAASGGAHMAFDMVGNATDTNATLAALSSLRRGGRLVLMGSMTTPLPVPYTLVMLNDWEILGQFMYPARAYGRLLELLRSGLLDVGRIQPRLYPLSNLYEAMDVAAAASNFEYVVMQPDYRGK
ncbi:zinc-binding dehydrogenase [Rhizobium lentis]|uniref:zinc-binding dehydrogenase n=1 Tax=Rhizobium lentis TaxID=1138194 RepID=UPI001C835809|nr:zinc-binding dehydrogenase [Rhizobium lentis]